MNIEHTRQKNKSLCENEVEIENESLKIYGVEDIAITIIAI